MNWLLAILLAGGLQRTTSLRPVKARPVVPRSQVKPVDPARLRATVSTTWHQAHFDMKVTFRKEIMETALERGERPRAEMVGHVAIVPTPRPGLQKVRLVHPGGDVEDLTPIEAQGPVTAFAVDVRLAPGRYVLQVIPEGRKTPAHQLQIYVP